MKDKEKYIYYLKCVIALSIAFSPFYYCFINFDNIEKLELLIITFLSGMMVGWLSLSIYVKYDNTKE